MMRVWIFLAALFIPAMASADNVLMKANGLGAAAAGMIGVAAGTAALAPPPEWKGFPKTGDGPQFQDDPANRLQTDCATSGGMAVAKALKGETPPETQRPQDGQIRLTDDTTKTSSAQMFDSKAIYGSGQSVTCPPQ